MDYKVELQNNNTDLESIISRINALPDADGSSGSGGGSGQNLTNEITAQKELISRLNQFLGIKEDTDEDPEEPKPEIDPFTTSTSGRIPVYGHGYATEALINLFTTSTVGIIK